ncbi:MAG: DNA-3-methyladenine glycosylase [Omnitrophica WOR_2 bacterium GWA2_47_8]|nr:MAG: DNA-3-methyladenine glycosylase [Omnitrophica WOR_2 bacterium GWA2_47_8]
MKRKKRCAWCENDPLYEKYHDEEWGTPCYDDDKLFEMLVLESFQAGLSWRIILNKRKNFRKAFHNFNIKKIARYGSSDVQRLLNDAGIVRNRLKILAAINNAQKFLEVQKEHGSFSKYIWQFAPKRSPKRRSLKDLPAKTAESDALAKDLKEKGFKFLGSTVCYAHMQATGMVNDHMKGCFKF